MTKEIEKLLTNKCGCRYSEMRKIDSMDLVFKCSRCGREEGFNEAALYGFMDAQAARIAELERRVSELENAGVLQLMSWNHNVRELVEETERLEKEIAKRDELYVDAVSDAAKRLLSGDLFWGDEYNEPATNRLKRTLEAFFMERAVAEVDGRVRELEKQLAEATQWRSPETAPRDGMFLALIERDRGFGRKPKYVYPMQFSTHKDGLPNERFFYGFGAYRDELPENGQGDESRFVGWLPLPQVKEER